MPEKTKEVTSKQKVLDAKMAELDKKFGKGSVRMLGDKSTLNIERVPMGIKKIDNILGGGLPKGRIIEIYGPEMAGKTTIALHAVAAVQKVGGQAAFIDVEHALDPVYASKLGVKLDELLVTQPDCGEDAMTIAEELISTGAVDILVVDSVAALTPRAELEGEMGDSHVGLQARLMSQALRKLTALVSSTGCILIFINQLREKIGVSYGNPETTTGGRALKFYSSIRIDVRKIEAIKQGTDIIGSKTKIKTAKNKTTAPFQEAIVDIYFGEGISRTHALVDVAIANGVIEKSGAWFTYKGDLRFQGRENLVNYFKEAPANLDELENIVDEFDKKEDNK